MTPEYEGAVDVDLGIGASTNTLPIRRLELPVGDTAEVVAAWVRFPDLSLEPLPQLPGMCERIASFDPLPAASERSR